MRMAVGIVALHSGCVVLEAPFCKTDALLAQSNPVGPSVQTRPFAASAMICGPDLIPLWKKGRVPAQQFADFGVVVNVWAWLSQERLNSA